LHISSTKRDRFWERKKLKTESRRSLRLIVYALVGAALAVAQAPTGTPQFGTTPNNNDYQLKGSHIVTIKGKLAPTTAAAAAPAGVKVPALPSTVQNICQFQIELKPGENAIEGRGVSPIRLNAEGGCELDMEIGEPPASAIVSKMPLPARARGATGAPQGAPQMLGIHRDDGVPTEPVSAGYARGWFTDPPGFHVNAQQNEIGWDWWGQYAPAYLYNYLTWVPELCCYWYQNAFVSWPTYYANQFPSWPIPTWDSAVGASAYAAWENDLFVGCLGYPTDAYYAPITVEGTNLGVLRGNFSWALYGAPCIYLLTPNFQVVRTYN
jgi:hypothetical protein